MDLSVLRRTTAEIAAAAVYELYPDIELLEGGETSTGFFYDFYFPHPIHHHLIEEKMRQIVKEKRPIYTLEMVPFSARELLKKEGHLARIEAMADDGLVEIIRIGDFYDLSSGPHLRNTAEIAAFKIFSKELPEKGLRIEGYCDRSKADLKEYLKKIEAYVEPTILGERMGLWKGDIWLSEGLKKRALLTQFLKGEWFDGAYEISGPLVADRLELHRGIGKEKIGEIWQENPHETHIQVSFLNKGEGQVNSCLHSIGKTLTILGFDHSTVSKGSETDYVVLDKLGRSRPLVQMRVVSKKGSNTKDIFFTTVVERIFSLLLEKDLFLQMVNIENK